VESNWKKAMKSVPISQADDRQSRESKKLIRGMPLLMSLVFGLLWAFTYFFFGRLHAMWRMFDKEFPLFLATILGVHKASMSPLTGLLFAFAEGVVIGGVLGFVFIYLLGTERKK
jgi:hypothetical protein